MSDHAGRGRTEPGPLRIAGNDRPTPHNFATPPMVGHGVLGVEDAHALDYVKLIYKRRHVALTAFLLVVGTVTLYTFTATPEYEARTRLLIETDNPNVVNFKQVIDEEQGKADYYQTQYNILQSRSLARRTLEALSLWDTLPFRDPENEANTFGRTLNRVVGFAAGMFGWGGREAVGATIPVADEPTSQSKAIDTFLKHLTVLPIRNSRLVDVKFRLPDAALAASVANALAKNYISENLNYRFTASKEASDWLGDRLAEQRKQVEDAELRLQRYREQNDAISLPDRENIVVQKLADLNSAVTRAKTERILKEALSKQIGRAQAVSETLDTFPAILMNTFIQQQKGELAGLQRQYAQMAEKLGDKHPDLIKVKSAIEMSQTRLASEIAKIVESVRSDYQAAQAQENSLTAALSQQKSEALAMNGKAIEYGVLQRDVESSRQIYDSLLQRAKETGVSGELRTGNIRVVDVAERPHRPVWPPKWINLSLAALGGGLLALVLVFAFEYLDNRIKTPDEIRTHLGLPYLGLLPLIEAPASACPLISRGVPANFGEAFRVLRTNVLFSSASEGGRSILVTSTAPGEGKSMVAANLSVSLAQAGQRVALVDADLRKPKVEELFELESGPGLSNLLVGSALASEVVQKSHIPGLWLMTAGRIPPNPAELLGSQSFRQLLGSLTEQFDWVVIDSPPVMAVTDAALVGHMTTGVLFVVGAEMTNRRAAATAIEQLGNAQSRFMGAVLNRVDLVRNGYYYSQYYRKEYGQYYARPAVAAR